MRPGMTASPSHPAVLALFSLLASCTQLQQGSLRDAAVGDTPDAQSDAVAEVPQSPCPSESSAFEDRCYYVSSTAPPGVGLFNYWQSADSDCSTRFGGHLVSVGSAQENQFVRSIVRGTSPFMIGFTDSDRATNDFVWLDGSPVTFTNWHPDEPNNHAVMRFERRLTEDWAMMGADGSWNDLPYTDGGPYVCEFTP